MIYAFAGYRLDTVKRSLHRDEERIVLGQREFQLLCALLSGQGAVVEKKDLYQAVWGSTTVGEDNLRQQIRLLRQKLGRELILNEHNEGYRLAANVLILSDDTPVCNTDPAPQAEAPAPQPLLAPESSASSLPSATPRQKLGWMTLAAAIMISIAYWVGAAARRTGPIPDVIPLASDGYYKVGAPWTDGTHVWFVETIDKTDWLASTLLAGGTVERVRPPDGPPLLVLADLRKSAPEFLLWRPSENEAGSIDYWKPGRSLETVAKTGSTAAWISSRKDNLAAASPGGISIFDRGKLTRAISVPGRVAEMRWLETLHLLRFTVFDASEHPAIWEMNGAGGLPVPASNFPHDSRVGGWSSDGSIFAFTVRGPNSSDVWIDRETGRGRRRIRVTAGPLDYDIALPTPDGRRILAMGALQRGELVRFNSETGRFSPYLAGIDAIDLDFARDGRSVAYIRLPEHTLWRARVDGNESVQLTMPPMSAHQPHWSPDGARIAFMADMPGTVNRIFVIAAAGGVPIPVTDDGAEQGVPTWSADGRTIVFGDRNHGKPGEMSIHLLDLKSRDMRELPGSKGKWTPRWSPDGEYIAAISADFRDLGLYDCARNKWRHLAQFHNLEHIAWTPDSRSIFFRGEELPPKTPTRKRALYRYDLRREVLVRLVDLDGFSSGSEEWFGISPDGTPLGAHGALMRELYSIRTPEM